LKGWRPGVSAKLPPILSLDQTLIPGWEVRIIKKRGSARPPVRQ